MAVVHIVIEAIDGAGKGTLLSGLREHIALRSLPLLCVNEPTNTGVGAVIRNELTKKHQDGHTYSGKMISEAFAIDRAILYTTTILPFKNSVHRGVILQDRSVVSSLTYQPLQDSSITREYLLSLHGNQQEIEHAPTVLIILNIAPEEAQRRLRGRAEKDDQSIFEESTFQEKLAAQYQDPSLRELFTSRGSAIIDINAQQPVENVLQDTLRALEPFLSSI